MPTGTLPKEGADLHKKVYDDKLKECMDKGGSEKTCKESAAEQAWGAVKQAGWKKGADGEWHKSLVVQEFSLRIDKASHDKATGENRWSAIASDTQTDLYNDSMSMELYSKFIDYIQSDAKVPEEFRSSFWDGGMPYLSVSHYMDLEGKGVPGEIDKLYIDGNMLRAKGKYFDTPLGRACYYALERDLYNPEGKQRNDKVRISIAFLDYKHKHKSNGFVFDRLTAKGMCPECLKDMLGIGDDAGKGRIFLDGQLIHLAHTRVPVNERTAMEVDKSMPKTRKEDAASIIGDDLAEMLDEESKLVGKSDAIIIKSDEEDVEDADEQVEAEAQAEAPVEAEEAETVTEAEEVSEAAEPEVEPISESQVADVTAKAVTKTENGCSHPSSHYLVVEDAQHPTTWHLLVKNCSGSYDHDLAGGAYAALTSNHRGHSYSGPNKSGALSKLHSIYNSQGWTWPTDNAKKSSALDTSFAELKAQFDTIYESDMSEDEKLRAIQEPYSVLGGVIVQSMKEPTPESESKAEVDAMVQAFSKALAPLVDKMDLISTQLTQLSLTPPANQLKQVTPVIEAPKPKNLTPLVKPLPPFEVQAPTNPSSVTPNLRALIDRNT